MISPDCYEDGRLEGKSTKGGRGEEVAEGQQKEVHEVLLRETPMEVKKAGGRRNGRRPRK